MMPPGLYPPFDARLTVVARSRRRRRRGHGIQVSQRRTNVRLCKQVSRAQGRGRGVHRKVCKGRLGAEGGTRARSGRHLRAPYQRGRRGKGRQPGQGLRVEGGKRGGWWAEGKGQLFRADGTGGRDQGHAAVLRRDGEPPPEICVQVSSTRAQTFVSELMHRHDGWRLSRELPLHGAYIKKRLRFCRMPLSALRL